MTAIADLLTGPMWYPKALAAIGAGGIDLTSDILDLYVGDDLYRFDPDEEFLADLGTGTVLGGPGTVTGTLTMPGRTLLTDTEVQTVPSVSPGANPGGTVWLTTEGSGTDATRRLLVCWQTEGDRTQINGETNGGDVTITFSTGEIARI